MHKYMYCGIVIKISDTFQKWKFFKDQIYNMYQPNYRHVPLKKENHSSITKLHPQYILLLSIVPIKM